VVVINEFNDEAFVIVSDVGAFNLRESERYKQHQIKYLYEIISYYTLNKIKFPSRVVFTSFYIHFVYSCPRTLRPIPATPRCLV